MKWIKLHTALPKNTAFRRLSPNARLTFFTALCLAGDLDHDGALSLRDVGPMTVAEIAFECGLTEKATQKSLDELISSNFLQQEFDTFVVQRWDEKTAPRDATGAIRMRRLRERNAAVTQSVTGDVTTSRNVTDTLLEEEGEVEEEVEGSAGAVPRARRVPRPPVQPDTIDFGPLESDVVAYVANAAAENKTGKISPGREAALRAELLQVRTDLENDEAFLAGLRAANANGAPNKTYVRKAAVGYAARTAKRAAPSAPEAARMPAYNLEDLR